MVVADNAEKEKDKAAVSAKDSSNKNADMSKAIDKSKDADKSKSTAEKDKEPNEDNWKDYLSSAKNSYKEGKLAESANDLELALLGAERLREGARGEAYMLIGEQSIPISKAV